MTVTVERLGLVPNAPAVYAMLDGRGASAYAAYVGVADKLRGCLEQHLVRRDSSAVTGAAAVALIPDNVAEVRWWEHPSFADRAALEAAELVAFDVLEPALRSRGRVQGRARELAAAHATAAEYRALFAGLPTGRLVLPTLQDALDRVAALERRLAELERRCERAGR